ncbi:unnamed protein product [Cochlearia groenlandica]
MTAVQKRPILPTQYNFTPATELPSPQEQVTNLAGPSNPPPPGVRDYPPPRALFQNSAPPPHNQTEIIEDLENSQARVVRLLKETTLEIQRKVCRSFRRRH